MNDKIVVAVGAKVGLAIGITAGAGALSGVASSLVTQGIEIAQGDREELSGEKLTTDFLIGIPSAFTGGAASSVTKGVLKKVFAKQIKKRLAKTMTLMMFITLNNF